MAHLKSLFTLDHDIFRTRSIADLIERSKGEHALKKVLGPFELIILGVGAIVGTGIFVVTGVAAGACLALILALPTVTHLRFVIWLALGLVIYFFYGIKNARRTGSALDACDAGKDDGA